MRELEPGESSDRTHAERSAPPERQRHDGTGEIGRAIRDLREEIVSPSARLRAHIHGAAGTLDRAVDFLDPDGRESFEGAGRRYAGPLREATERLGSEDAGVVHAARRDVLSLLRILGGEAERIGRPGLHARRADQEHIGVWPFDLAQLVELLVEPFEGLARARDVDLRVSGPESLTVEADVTKVERVVLNLLFHAVKHTPVGGSMSVDLDVDEGLDEAVLSVSDSGLGLSAEQAAHVFEHARHNERSAFLESEGIGLSLGLARDWVIMHGGTMTVGSAAPRGVRLEMRLPVRAPTGVTLREPPRRRPELALRVADFAASELLDEASLESRPLDRKGRALVLIACESPSLQRTLVQLLEPRFATASCLSRWRLRDRITRLWPDLVIADLSSSSAVTAENSRENQRLLSELREAGVLRWIPLLAIVGGDQPDEAVALLDGVDDVIHKPLFMSEVRARVAKLLEARETRALLNQVLGGQETSLLTLAEQVAGKQRELGRALDQLAEAKASAEAANKIKSNFLRMISHELRTPVTAMQLQLRILDRLGGVGGEGSNSLAVIERASHRLMLIVDTVIAWARVESSRWTPRAQTFDLVKLTSAVRADLEPFAATKSLTVSVVPPGEDISMRSDARMAELLLRNLIMRAVQITEQGGPVEVSFLRTGDVCSVLVQDGAPTSSPREIQETLEPLASAGDISRRGGVGSGMGLHVVRDLARSIRGDLLLRPHREQGNVVELVLRPLRDDTPAGATDARGEMG